MKRIMIGMCAMAGVVGCSTVTKPVIPPRIVEESHDTELSAAEVEKLPVVYRETATSVEVNGKIPELKWGSFGSDLAVHPFAQGPVDTYRPLYKINETKKITAKGMGRTEQEAAKNAIYNGCIKEGCDYIVAAQQLVRTFDKDKKLCFEVTVIGFPAVLTGVQTIKATFYEKSANGNLKEMPAPEHRYILSADGAWSAGVLSGEHGKPTSDENIDVKEEKEVTVKHEEKETTAKDGRVQGTTMSRSSLKTVLGI